MTVSFQNGSFFGGSAIANTNTSSGGVSVASLYNEGYLDNKYSYNDKKESYELAYSGRDAALDTKISNIGSYLAKGQEDKAMTAYQELLEQISSQERYSQIAKDETQLKSIARQMIEAEIGTDLEDFIRENAKTASGVEAQKLLSWGNCDSTSQEDLLKAMCDIDEDESHSLILDGLAIIVSPFVVLGNALFNGGKKM